MSLNYHKLFYPVFLRFTKVKRGSAVLEYASIAERLIEDKKQKTSTLKYLGPVKSDEDRERYRKIFDEYREAMRKFSLDDLNIKPTLSFGLFYASRAIMERNGILKILEGHTRSYSEILSFMIISKLFDPSSDIELTELAGKVYYPWELHISEDNVYRSLDSIIARKDEIEIDLFNTLKPDTSTVHYDLTSSYFEGRENNDLVLFGYSWDKKRGKEQIVIGLVIADGIPIHHEVWPGNTVDPKTLESTISVLKERFLIKNVTFVGDGAFGRSKSLNLLDQNRYITAAYRLDQPYRNILMETDFTYFQTMNDLIIKKVTINVNDVMKEEKTGITEAENGFDFLGFHFVRHFSSRRNKRVTRWLPSKMSMKAIRQKIREKTGNKALSAMTPWNALKGWRPPSKDGSTTSGAASVGNHLPAHGNKLTNASD